MTWLISLVKFPPPADSVVLLRLSIAYLAAALVTGLGFGGGVPDLYGYLAPLAKPGMAYAEINAARDNFFRMHLPLFEFFLKSGLLGGIIFFYLSIKNFKNNNIFSFFFFLIFFTVFSNNKEMIMLAFFFLRLSIIKKVSTNQMVVSSC